jgi:hypothetical protein
MSSLFSDLPPEARLTILIIGSVLMTAVAIVLISVWARIRRLHLEADLKTDMLERGMTPDEIRQVLSTPMRGRSEHEIKAELKERLVDKGLDAKQIKEIVKAGDEWWQC